MGTWHGYVPRGELGCGCIAKKTNHCEHEGTPHRDRHWARLFPPSPKRLPLERRPQAHSPASSRAQPEAVASPNFL